MNQAEIMADFVSLGITDPEVLHQHLHFAQIGHVQCFGQPLFVPEKIADHLGVGTQGTCCPITKKYLKIVHKVFQENKFEDANQQDLIMNLIKAKVDEYNEKLKKRGEEALKNIPPCWFEENDNASDHANASEDQEDNEK